MTTVKDMLTTYPADLGQVDRDNLTRCIEECIACAQACTACADACLSEGMVGELTWAHLQGRMADPLCLRGLSAPGGTEA